jgi:hypothetical protein
MMTPIFVWSNLFPRQSETTPGYQHAVRSISDKVTNGISDFTGGIWSTFRKIKRKTKRRDFVREDDSKNESIGSRGYEEFQEGCPDKDETDTQCLKFLISCKGKFLRGAGPWNKKG